MEFKCNRINSKGTAELKCAIKILNKSFYVKNVENNREKTNKVKKLATTLKTFRDI